MVKKPKYSVLCGCGKKQIFSAEDVRHNVSNYSSDTAIKERIKIDRYYVVCKKCRNHANVAKIISEEIKNEVKLRFGV